MYKCILLTATKNDSEITSPLYRRSDNGELVTGDTCPFGSLIVWDGMVHVKVPGDWSERLENGVWWNIDSPGRKWVRTGELPEITVTPSIKIGEPERWHGWLKKGWLYSTQEQEPQ